MASQVDRLIEDQNFNVYFNGASVVGKANATKTQRKGGLGGRKPLGDLSNSGKPALTQASKNQPPKNFSFVEEVTCVPKTVHDASKMKGFSNASDKVQTRSRKALSDISNSGKTHLLEESRKLNLLKKCNTKLSVVAEEPFCPSAVAEEGFLHNHQECINAQTKAMDMDHFLMTVGLHNDSSKTLASPWGPALSSKFQPQSPLRYLDVGEMSEPQSSWKHKLSDNLNSPHPCKTPRSPSHCSLWKDCDYINFKLMETPGL